jgi:predicted RNA-binding Zn ribbon-like protein
VIDRSLPWLGFPPGVDLANTVVQTPVGPVDLLATEEDLAQWVAVEIPHLPDAGAATGRLEDVRLLRDAVHVLLHAAVRGSTPPREVVAAVNEASAASPVVVALEKGTVVERTLAASPFDRFRGAVARSAIEVFGSEALSRCDAPSCGMLFLASRARQSWCSPSCGNRARVARHARRASRIVGEHVRS